jgi:hypothetical protein
MSDLFYPLRKTLLCNRYDVEMAQLYNQDALVFIEEASHVNDWGW